MYLAWAAFYEGRSDQSYFNVLLPRVIEDILIADGARQVTVPLTPAAVFGQNDRSVEAVAHEICEHRDAFHLLFVHADTGGRGLESGLVSRREAFALRSEQICSLPLDRTVLLSPRHETEAWALADADAVCAALGFSGSRADLNLPAKPAEAERLDDPKAILAKVASKTHRRRAKRPGSELLTVIAQEQRIDCLREAPSFQEFENSLRVALSSLGCIA